MGAVAQKAELHRYLTGARDSLLWKLDGLSEYDVRRPMTPTGTNLLGVVKHVATVAAAYFGFVFERPFPEPVPGLADDADPNVDLWATADESFDDVTAFWGRVWAHADATIDALDLDDPGRVPWWPAELNPVTLQRILVHMTAETNRHAGQADIVRELIDGAVGMNPAYSNLPDGDAAWWAAYRDRLDEVARRFRAD